jgi:hypothetical protein
VASPLSDLHYPPSVSKRFTSFASQLLLERTPSQTVAATTGPAAAGGLPVQLVVEVGTADQHLDYIDGAGAVVAMNFEAVGTYVLRMSPTSIETSTTVTAVTAFWMPRER